MTVHDGTTARDAGPGGRARLARPTIHPGPLHRDGVLALVTAELVDRPDPLSRIAVAQGAMVENLRAERDAALEEVAFLREQLGSARAFHVYELEQQCARLHAERMALLRQLAILGEQVRRHGYQTSVPDGELTTDDDADATAPR